MPPRFARIAALGVTALVLALTVAAPGAGAATASLPDIEDEVMCTICGTLLAQSESPQAERERALIRRLIARGQTKEEIKDALVAQYGPRVLATPSGEGFDLLAWLVPGAAIAAAIAAGAFGLARLRRRARAAAAPAPDPPAADLARLERDMSDYDL